MTTQDLVEFLRARLDEREQRVKRLRGMRYDIDMDALFLLDEDALLRDIEAKRRIIDAHGPYDLGSSQYCATCGDVPQVWYPCDTLCALALPDDQHPDYEQEWKL